MTNEEIASVLYEYIRATGANVIVLPSENHTELTREKILAMQKSTEKTSQQECGN